MHLASTVVNSNPSKECGAHSSQNTQINTFLTILSNYGGKIAQLRRACRKGKYAAAGRSANAGAGRAGRAVPCGAKAQAESKYPWDYLAVVAKIPAAEAFRPSGAGGCALSVHWKQRARACAGRRNVILVKRHWRSGASRVKRERGAVRAFRFGPRPRLPPQL
jgi:hypothetical protein